LNFLQKNNIFKYAIVVFFWFGFNLSFSQINKFSSNNFELDPLFPSLFLDSLSYENNEIIINSYFGNIFLGEKQYFTRDQYENYLFNKQFQDYWKNRISRNANLDVGGEIPKVGLGEEVLNKIFGSNTVSIRPQGAVELTFSGVVNKIDNPSLPEAQRKTTSFNFDERIQVNVIGRIGEKLQLQANYDTEATFEFENEMKLEYTGDEDDIIKKIELGNVNLPLSGSLITGAQSLFGIKSKFQFGRATLTTVFSEQKSESSIIEIEGGAQKTDFEITIDNYEKNRHFFLSQYFHQNYDQALSNLPIINSAINITRIEVYVTNKNSSTVNTRNILALQDLGEQSNNVASPMVADGDQNLNWPTNLNNSLNPSEFINEINLQTGKSLRNIDEITSAFNLYTQGTNQFFQSIDYEKIENARMLSSSEYTFNRQLGFISLNQSLNSDEVLAVAFQYTYNGVSYQVGEFSNDVVAPDVLCLKLLKSTVTDVSQPMWDLMMKNVYGLGAYQVSKEDFILDIFYENPELGTPVNFLTEGDISNQLLIQVFNFDKLNNNNDPGPDGVFDFIDGVTINASNGRVYFPMVNPFGCFLREKLGGNCEFIDPNSIASKYAFEALYDSTQYAAQQIPELNRFLLKGQYKSSVSSDISLNAMNIPQGSVRVTSGGTQLEENIHYTVDYTMGSVKIIDQGILNSSSPIMISLENNSLFNFQTKRFLGAHLDYKINKDFILGASVLNLTEKPLTQKINIGDEPISNTIWGLNGAYSTESRFLTKMVDKLPFIQTKEKSTFSVVGEFAHFIPGHPKSINIDETGTSYVDDFENTQSAIDIRSASSWYLSSTPTGNIGSSGYFAEGLFSNDLSYGYNRAKLAWYVIDPLFQRNSSITPSHIVDDSDQQESNYVREVLITEIFPNKDIVNGQPSRLRTFDLAFYPTERGPYNFDVSGSSGISSGINESGLLINPESRWGGIMREIETNDFEAANIEFIEFWMLDPYIDDPGSSGGDLFFNLGNISEDILKDSRKSFENGLPIDGSDINIDTTVWGRVPNIQSLVNAFDNEPSSRVNQDVGYDGMDDEYERTFIPPNSFTNSSYLQQIESQFSNTSQAYLNAFEDPSADNFHYFRGSDYDQEELPILARYKLINGSEGNSPTSEQSVEDYPTSSTNLPNAEDINNDQTLSEVESYYQYKISLRTEDLVVGSNFITDEINGVGPNGNSRWLQFKIPINSYTQKIGTIQDFKSIRFIRMFFNGFENEVICRFASMELVRGEWRRYLNNLSENEDQLDDNNTIFDISVINIEENGFREPINYVLPNGVEREVLTGATSLQEQNEQSMVLKVIDLENGDSKAAFKNVNMDMRNYKRIKMYVHAEAINEETLDDGDVAVFLRIGSDYTNNFYEYEIPLKLTNWSESDPNFIWPSENQFDIPFDLFQSVKQIRNNVLNDPQNNQINSFNDLFEYFDGNNKVSVLGNPNLGDVKSIMIGLRNSETSNDISSKSVEVWVNELRLTDFDEKGGWATRMQMKMGLADLGNLAVAGSISSIGFGSLEKNISERNMEETQRYNVSSTLELGNFLPEKSNIKIPMYFSISEDVKNPQYNPLDPDILLKTSLSVLENKEQRDSLKEIAQDYTKRKSINFTNIRKDRGTGNSKTKLYDVENLSLSYSYNESFYRNINTEYSINKQYNGGISYNFNTSPKNIKPFNKIKALRKGKYLRIIRDFNFYLMPKQISFRTDIFRSYLETKLRNNTGLDFDIQPTYSKYFTLNRTSNIKYDLTRSLKLNFSSNTRSIIDEPDGEIDKKEEVDSIMKNILSLGRATEYHHNFDIRYSLPINKIPIFSWVNTNITYDGSYDWNAASLSAESFGNSIQNTNSLRLNTQLSFSSLYNKIPFLKKLLSDKNNNKRNQSRVDINKKTDGKDEKKEKDKINELLKYIMKPIFSLKNVSIAYSETNGSFLPGFLPNTGFLGINNSLSAPTLGFVLGSQKDIRDLAAERGWLTTDTLMNNLFSRTNSINLNLRATVEPVSRFKIMLTASRRYATNQTEYFKNDPDDFGNPNWVSISPTTSGNFSMSFMTIKTSFVSDGVNNNSQLFDDFVAYRMEIAQKIAQQNGIQPNLNEFPDGYGPNSQDVIIPAFLAAYSGRSPAKQNLNLFPSIPWPNWNINYDGLIKLKWFKERFKNISVSHNYRSTYSIGSFINNLNFGDPEYLLDTNGNYLPEFQIDQVSISEQFAPFLKFDMTMKNSISARVEYKRDRTVSLSLTNSQITEVKGNEYVAGLGYRIQDVRLLFNGAEEGSDVKSDLDIRADFSLRENKTIIRKIEELSNQPTSGQILITLKFSADYVIGNTMNIKLFYDQVITDYVVSSSFPTSNTNVGLSIRYNLN
tara:strand:+ start:5110 stop:12201 length:7092 start_codon:yes stop_codon:yes gene_type:complete